MDGIKYTRASNDLCIARYKDIHHRGVHHTWRYAMKITEVDEFGNDDEYLKEEK